mgnify:CR=1 FL=1
MGSGGSCGCELDERMDDCALFDADPASCSSSSDERCIQLNGVTLSMRRARRGTSLAAGRGFDRCACVLSARVNASRPRHTNASNARSAIATSRKVSS